MSHVIVQFFVAEEAFMTELAEGMYTTLNLFFWHTLLLSTLGGGKMYEVLGGRVQRMFVWEYFLVADAEVTVKCIQTIRDRRGQIGAHHMNFLWTPRTCSLRSFQPVAMWSQEESGQLKRSRTKVSCIISSVSNDITNFSSLNGVFSGV
jgi:hypothetical protein